MQFQSFCVLAQLRVVSGDVVEDESLARAITDSAAFLEDLRVDVNGLLVFAKSAVDPGGVIEHAELASHVPNLGVRGAGPRIEIQRLLVLTQISENKACLEKRVRFPPAIADRLSHR